MVNPLEPFEQAMWKVLETMQEFAINYIFGILALLFGIRSISSLISGRISIISCVLAIVFLFLAVTMGQTFWTNIPGFEMFTFGK